MQIPLALPIILHYDGRMTATLDILPTKTIWKYPLEIRDNVVVRMPYGAIVRYVAVQNDELCLWAEVNPHNEGSFRTFAIVGTGHGFPVSPEGMYLNYLGSVQHMNMFVWHVYEYIDKVTGAKL